MKENSTDINTYLQQLNQQYKEKMKSLGVTDPEDVYDLFEVDGEGGGLVIRKKKNNHADIIMQIPDDVKT